MTSLLFAPLLGPLPCRQQARVRRGGWRQRQAMEQPGQAAVIDNGFIGRLGSGMFLDFCDGEITAYRLCKHMQHAVQDGSECRLSKALGKIGTPDSAVCRSNEGVMHLMSSLPVLGIISRLPGSTTTHFIKPTDLIGLFQDHYPLQFRLRFGADTQEVGAFWARFFDSTVRARWVDQHMFLRGKSAADLEKTIPLVVHQDAGPCSKTHSADCISFSSLLGQGSEKVTKFLLSTYISDPGNDTLVWDAILSDLRLAADQGVGGWHFCLLFAKADEEQRSIKWGIPSYNDPMDVCSECLSNRSNRPFSDLSRTARWRPSEDMPVDCYIARIRDNPRHPLASSCVFYTMFFSIGCHAPA